LQLTNCSLVSIVIFRMKCRRRRTKAFKSTNLTKFVWFMMQCLYCKEKKLFPLLVFNKICLPCHWHFSTDVFSKKQMCVNRTHVYRTQLMIVEIMKCYDLSRLREVWNGLLKIYFIPRLLMNIFSISQNVGWGNELYLAYYLSFPHT